MSHKRRIADTWDPAWGAGNNAFQTCGDVGPCLGAGNSEFQTAAKDLSALTTNNNASNRPDLVILSAAKDLSAITTNGNASNRQAK